LFRCRRLVIPLTIAVLIALWTIIGKLIDLVLLHKLTDKLLTSDLQFGFKEGHSKFISEFISF